MDDIKANEKDGFGLPTSARSMTLLMASMGPFAGIGRLSAKSLRKSRLAFVISRTYLGTVVRLEGSLCVIYRHRRERDGARGRREEVAEVTIRILRASWEAMSSHEIYEKPRGGKVARKRGQPEFLSLLYPFWEIPRGEGS